MPLAGPDAAEDHRHGLEQDLEIEPQRPLAHVRQIERADLFERPDVAAAAHLPQAGQAGQHVELLVVVGRERGHLRGKRGARPDQGHLAAHHVEQLRQLVQARLAEPLAEAGRARVVRHLEERAVHLVVRLELGQLGFGIHVHGAELVHPELLAVQADAALLEEHRPRRVQLDQHGHGRDHGGRGEGAHEHGHMIHEPLHHAARRRQRGVGGVHLGREELLIVDGGRSHRYSLTKKGGYVRLNIG